MSLCESPNETTLRAGPPLEVFRTSNIYTQCLVDRNVNTSNLTNETNTYTETPLEIQELPDLNDYKMYTHLDKGIFVIPYDRPTTILVANPTIMGWGKKVIRCRTQRNGSTLPVSERKRSQHMIYHTFLTDGAPVLAAGEFNFDGKNTITIQNHSGHYYPSEKTLYYAKCLLEKKGYQVVLVSRFGPRNTEFNRNSKTLSEWKSKPYKKWYIEMAKPKGGKRKTRKQKTRKSMRGK